VVHHTLRGHGVAHDGWAPRAHNARLLPANALAVRAQKLCVVDVDAGDDGAVGVDHVRGIQASSEADFENRHIQQRMAHQAQDGQGGELKIRKRDLIAVLDSGGLHCLKMRYQIGRRDDFAMHPAALFKVHQMRRGVHAGAITCLQRHRLQHGAGRSFAVGARHRDHRALEPQCHAAGDFRDPVQAHVDIAGVQLLAVAQPAFQCVGFGLHTARDCRRARIHPGNFEDDARHEHRHHRLRYPQLRYRQKIPRLVCRAGAGYPVS